MHPPQEQMVFCHRTLLPVLGLGLPPLIGDLVTIFLANPSVM